MPKIKTRSLKSTIALIVHPPNKPDPELFLILFTTQNKTGQRYILKDNINRVFSRFIEEGKVTISLKLPEHDIQIKGEPIQLKFFLKALQSGLQGKFDNMRFGNITTQAAPKSSHPVKKLVINSRGDYPLHGFPRTLTSLKVCLFFC